MRNRDFIEFKEEILQTYVLRMKNKVEKWKSKGDS